MTNRIATTVTLAALYLAAQLLALHLVASQLAGGLFGFP